MPRGSGSRHHTQKGRRYRYYVSAGLITDAGTDRAEGWRLAAREIEGAVIRILADALTSPAGLVERFGADGMPSDQVRKLLARAARMAAALGGSPGERAKLVRELVPNLAFELDRDRDHAAVGDRGERLAPHRRRSQGCISCSPARLPGRTASAGVKFAADSLLEESGFELSVPPETR